ncbi:DNA-binding CsgD family transcriptional regulator [Hoeflea halophila]|uniref:DNA-binding CsgD family transcriptional regulator n=1 Tax=Hoeflea halophila TaxID=714899 RepID=A0A286HKM3_9HYPH|nr:helix-turn-helix transcriptional regulator [Hoeflea halophila]SOE08355.1 DNA-binding CsgD family transcriptional regulator [Hoeflea halophila]
MLVTETVLHLGPELERAVNRMDFFRLFKSLAGSHGFSYFGVTEVVSDEQGINLQHVHALHNLPASWFEDPKLQVIDARDPVFVRLQQSSAPCVMDLGQTPSEVLGCSGSDTVVIVPLHAATGKRYCLILVGGDAKPDHQALALIALDAALIFQRYFEVILSLDSISGLSDREIQIVRWTSEGKTSAEIAIILGLSEHTVNSYIAAVLRKLHVVNRAQMVASAIRSGLIT